MKLKHYHALQDLLDYVKTCEKTTFKGHDEFSKITELVEKYQKERTPDENLFIALRDQGVSVANAEYDVCPTTAADLTWVGEYLTLSDLPQDGDMYEVAWVESEARYYVAGESAWIALPEFVAHLWDITQLTHSSQPAA